MNNFSSKLQICLLSENAKIPTKGSNHSAGFDLYSVYDYSVLELLIMTIEEIFIFYYLIIVSTLFL